MPCCRCLSFSASIRSPQSKRLIDWAYGKAWASRWPENSLLFPHCYHHLASNVAQDMADAYANYLRRAYVLTVRDVSTNLIAATAPDWLPCQYFDCSWQRFYGGDYWQCIGILVAFGALWVHRYSYARYCLLNTFDVALWLCLDFWPRSQADLGPIEMDIYQAIIPSLSLYPLYLRLATHTKCVYSAPMSSLLIHPFNCSITPFESLWPGVPRPFCMYLLQVMSCIGVFLRLSVYPTGLWVIGIYFAQSQPSSSKWTTDSCHFF